MTFESCMAVRCSNYLHCQNQWLAESLFPWVFVSTGGVHAAMVGSLHRSPVAILPFLTPHCASVAFCEGILRYGTAWKVLMRDELRNGSMTREQVLERMQAVLSLTDVTQFPAPEPPKPVIFVAATVLLFTVLVAFVLFVFLCAPTASYVIFFVCFFSLVISLLVQW